MDFYKKYRELYTEIFYNRGEKKLKERTMEMRKLFGKKKALKKTVVYETLKLQLKEQIKIVIRVLETDKLKTYPNNGMLQLIHKRYLDAQKFLEEDNLDKIMIQGGGRAYADAFSDYRCLLVEELGKAEELLETCEKFRDKIDRRELKK